MGWAIVGRKKNMKTRWPHRNTGYSCLSVSSIPTSWFRNRFWTEVNLWLLYGFWANNQASGFYPSNSTAWVFPCLKQVGPWVGNRLSLQEFLWRTVGLVGAGIDWLGKANSTVSEKLSIRRVMLVLYISLGLVNCDFFFFKSIRSLDTLEQERCGDIARLSQFSLVQFLPFPRTNILLICLAENR